MLIKMDNNSSSQIFQSANYKHVTVKMIDILLVVLQKIIRGTASVSNNIINEKFMEYEIHLFTNQIKVTVQHKLQDEQNFELEDAKLKDCRIREKEKSTCVDERNNEAEIDQSDTLITENPLQCEIHSPRSENYLAEKKCEFDAAVNLASSRELKNQEEIYIKNETPELLRALYSKNPADEQATVQIKENDILPFTRSAFSIQNPKDTHEIVDILCKKEFSEIASSTLTNPKEQIYDVSLNRGGNGKEHEILNSSQMDDVNYPNQYSNKIETDCLVSSREKLKNNFCFPTMNEEFSVMDRDFQGVVGHVLNSALNKSPSKFPAADVSITEIPFIGESGILHHPESNTKKGVHKGSDCFKCKYCNKVFGKLTESLEHEKIHKKQKSYPCSYCAKTFTSATNKQIHERVHTGEKPYSCRFCGKSFSQRNNRRDHELIHSGVKPHACKYCGKLFRTVTAVNYHEKTHTGEKPHSCSYCSKSFIREIDKISHERSHKEERY